MPIQITAALSFIIALIIIWRANKDVDTDDSLILSILIAGINNHPLKWAVCLAPSQ